MVVQEMYSIITVQEDINLCGPRPRQTTTLYIFMFVLSKAQPVNITQFQKDFF